MSQIDQGQQGTEDQNVLAALADDTGQETAEYGSEDERIFAEEVERREAEERGEEVPAQAPPAPAEPQVASEPEAQPDEDKPSWYAEVSPEAQAAYDAQQQEIKDLQWQYSAVHGRLAPVQAQVETLRTQLSRQRQPAAQVPRGGQPSPRSSTPEPDFESKEFKEFAETYPDEAAQMRTLYTAQRMQVQRLEERLDSLSQGVQQIQSVSNSAEHVQQLNTLAERHPDWMQVRNSENFDMWLQTQPASVRPLVDSSEAADCVYLLDRYKQDVYIWNLQQQANGAAPVDTTSSRASQTEQHRQSLVNTPTPDPQGGGVGVPGISGQPRTAEELWVEEVERRLRAQKQMR